MGDVQGIQERAEAVAVFGQIDRVRRGAPDGHSGLFQGQRQFERRLAAELDDDSIGLLQLDHVEYVLVGQGLEVELSATS